MVHVGNAGHDLFSLTIHKETCHSVGAHAGGYRYRESIIQGDHPTDGGSVNRSDYGVERVTTLLEKVRPNESKIP